MAGKKKILIVTYSMVIGGVETSLINFVRNLKDDFEIEVALLNKSGKLLKDLEAEVKVFEVCENLAGKYEESQFSKHDKWLKKFIKSCLKKSVLVRRMLKKRREKTVAAWPSLEKEYDIAIAYYAGDFYVMKYVLDKVKAAQKFTFIHADLRHMICAPYTQQLFGSFDKIICVSDSLKKQLQHMHPKLADKAESLPIFLDMKRVADMSKEKEITLSKHFNLISVSRLFKVKAIPRTIKVLGKLKKDGLNFHWTIVGDGPERNRIQKDIKRYKLENNVTIIGYTNNPFVYLKSADLFMLNSYHESFGMVLVEAMSLGVPVFTTNTLSAHEVVTDKGCVCDNSANGIYNALKGILQNKNEVDVMKEKVTGYEYPNQEIKQRFFDLVSNRKETK